MGTDNSVSGVELEGEPEPVPSQKVVAAAEPKPAPKALPPQPEIADWASDEELIDTAEGFDPSPDEPVEIIENAPARGGENGSSPRQAASHAKPGGRPEGASAAPSQRPSIPQSSERSRALDVK